MSQVYMKQNLAKNQICAILEYKLQIIISIKSRTTLIFNFHNNRSNTAQTGNFQVSTTNYSSKNKHKNNRYSLS